MLTNAFQQTGFALIFSFMVVVQIFGCSIEGPRALVNLTSECEIEKEKENTNETGAGTAM